MAQDSFNVSAPGSLMLFGEHAVLRGAPAIATSVDQRIRIRVTPKTDRKVRIRSALGQFEEHIDELEVVAPFTFMLTAIQNDPIFTGAIFDVESTFDSTVGLGSSAAVTVATVAALRHLREQPFNPADIFAESVVEVRQAQGGRGSGTDVAAAAYGGVVYYTMEPAKIEKLEVPLPPISLIYSGYKVPTPEVIAVVDAQLKKDPKAGKKIFADMKQITQTARRAILAQDWAAVGACMNEFHTCQRALGVSNEDLEDIVEGLRDSAGIVGAKISGSGLGDSVIGLGADNAEIETFEKIPVAASDQGVCLEPA